MPNPHYYASHVASLIGSPDTAPVTLALVKQHLRVDHTEDDALIQVYIDAATAHLDGLSGVLGRAIVNQNWRLTVPYSDAPIGTDKLYLPVLSARELLAVKYYNALNALVTATLSDFAIVANSSWAYVVPANGADWPVFYDRHDALIIEWKAGFGDIDDVPASLKAAIFLMVGDMYRNRETVAMGGQVSEIPMSSTVNSLIAPYRFVGI